MIRRPGCAANGQVGTLRLLPRSICRAGDCASATGTQTPRLSNSKAENNPVAATIELYVMYFIDV